MSDSEQSSPELVPVLRALRRPGHEAQFTQVIAAVAGQDSAFASALATVLVADAPSERARAALGAIPPALSCAAEVRLRDSNESDVGQVDLRFRDDAGSFCLLAELKLHSTYGVEQLPRYLAGLVADRATQKALVAVTTATPQFGEDAITRPDLFLGSVRWSKIFDRLHGLPHRHVRTRQVWQTLLSLMRQQGDFGPMDVDEEAVRAWALRDQAEQQMRYWLTELLQPIAAALETTSSAVPGSASRVLRPVVPWRGQLHAKIAVPAEAAEERLRVGFWADQRVTYFDVEARYEHPTERLDEDPRIDEVGVLVRTLSPAANRGDRATTQPVGVATGTVGDRCAPGRLPLVALSRWP